MISTHIIIYLHIKIDKWVVDRVPVKILMLAFGLFSAFKYPVKVGNVWPQGCTKPEESIPAHITRRIK